MNEAAARGALLGFALGDAVGAVKGAVPPGGELRGTVATQLLCASAEGLIRHSVGAAEQVSHAPSIVAHATLRWAAGQGIATPGVESWVERAEVWPDGWLTQVPAYRARRGSAPATVKALKHGPLFGQPRFFPTSRGAHAIARTLPAGLYSGGEQPAREISHLAHTGDAVNSAVLAAMLVHALAEEDTVLDALNHTLDTMSLHTTVGDRLRLATVQELSPAALAMVAPDATAASTLIGGFLVAAHCPDAGGVADALRTARTAPYATGVAALAGAFLGARFGAGALPVALVSRLELAWVVDTLAHDTVRAITERPDDEGWATRYPGW